MTAYDWLAWAALGAWVVTAAGGLTLLWTWYRHGGEAGGRREGRRIGQTRLLTHVGLAVGGLVLWLVYLVAEADVAGWLAFLALLAAATLGFTMFGTWVAERTEEATGEAPDTPEMRFSLPVVGAHGLLAATTGVFVLLALLRLGE